ncbi:MAG: hypothetical protein WAN43_20775 [Rhodomicrobium sp.]
MRMIAFVFAASMLGFQSLALAGPPDAYKPGLGEFMAAIQLRHAKLWFAGKAKNWRLAAYELGELKEAFEDAAKYQPDFKGKPIAELVEPVTGEPVAALERAIAAKDAAGFAKTMDRLSAACTSCHQSTGYGFIVIQRPTSPPLTNQRFDPKPSPDQRALAQRKQE